MIVYSISISFILLAGILSHRFIGIRNSTAYKNTHGLTEFINNSNELLDYGLRVLKHLRKISLQYAFHLFVRMLYYFQLFSNKVYAFARNKFMKSTIPDKKAVSRFWDTLKGYKAEIDQEKKK
jgi:hypothetical protein